jgi:hypothetical protein
MDLKNFMEDNPREKINDNIILDEEDDNILKPKVHQ